MAKDVTTVEEEDELPSSVSSQSCETLTLCVAFCRTQPWRLGEVLSISGETRGRPSIWGRGAASEAGPHVLLGQHRPGRWLPSPPLNAPAISRQQLSLESIGDAHILVENLGKCPMFRNGKAVARTELAPGDLLRLGKQLLFVCVRRAASSQGWDYPEFPFGGADPSTTHFDPS